MPFVVISRSRFERTENAKEMSQLTIEQLPSERQIDKSKLFDYLLHPVNSRGKLGHFSRYGYSQGNWEDLHASLLEHAQKHLVTRVVATKFGTKYIVTGVLNTPSGRQPLPIITAVWQKDTGKVGVRLITAYPD